MNTEHKIIAGESFGVMLLAFRCDDGSLLLCMADGEGDGTGTGSPSAAGSGADSGTAGTLSGTGADAAADPAAEPLAVAAAEKPVTDAPAGDTAPSCEPVDLTDIRIACTISTTPLGDRLRGVTADGPDGTENGTRGTAGPGTANVHADAPGTAINAPGPNPPCGPDFPIHRRAGEPNLFFFNITAAQSARLSAGPLRLAITFTGSGWTAIVETVPGRIVKLK